MTNLDIFIFFSFTILVFALSKINDKYQAAKNLLDAFVEEIENLNTINKKYQDQILDLENIINSNTKDIQYKTNLLEEKHLSQLKDLRLQQLDLASQLEKQKLKNTQLEKAHSLEIKKTIEDTRKDTLKRSRSVLRGQASEHLAPFVIKDTNPKDYRFMGNPVDYVCFEGLSDLLDGQTNEITSVKFVDIKTGKSSLNKSQRRIRDAINNGAVTFQIINLDEVFENDSTRIQQKNKSTQES